MSVKSYPDIIYVANFKDIFGNNNSDLYPSTVPNVILYTEINNVRPVFINPYTATIVLKGVFNHCIYDGQYYKLLKIKVIDVVEDIYEYQMEYDVMLNILASECEVRGTLVRTNKPEILEDCLQTTVPILENPSVNVVGGFDIKEYDGRKDLEIKMPEDPIIDYDISLTAWAQFINRLKSNPYIKAIKAGGKWDTSKSTRSQKHSINPLFVVDILQKSESMSGKNEILSMVSDFLSNLENVDIRIQNTITGSYLQGKKCLTSKTAAIGDVIDETSTIEQIDLSNLIDIVMVDHNGHPISDKNPNSFFRRFDKKNLDNENILVPPEEKDLFGYGKLCRKPHLPLRPKGVSLDDKQMYLPIDTGKDYGPRLKNYEETEYTGCPPQIITFKDGVGQKNAKKGWLWYINRIDFAMVDGWRGWFEGNKEQYKPFNERTYFDDGREYGASYFFRKLDRRSIPPLGFLIYQLNKQHQVGDDYEYISETPLKTIQYRSGLINTILQTNEETHWWGAANQALRVLNGIEEVSLFLLRLDFLNGMCVAPSLGGGYAYKGFDSNLWGYKNFHVGQQHSTGYSQYAAEFLNGDLQGNGELFTNPIRDNKTSLAHIYYRQELINSVSIYDNLEMKYTTDLLNEKREPIVKDIVINQNDIFCSDLDWTFKETPFQLNELPFELTKSIIEEVSRDVLAGAAGVPAIIGAKQIGKGVLEIARFITDARTGSKFGSFLKIHEVPKFLADKGWATRDLLLRQKYFSQAGAMHRYSKSALRHMLRRSKEFYKFRATGSVLSKSGQALKYFGKAIGRRSISTIKGLTKSAGIALKAGVGGARVVAGLKSLGISLALEAAVGGIEAIVNANKHDNANRQKNSIYTMGDFFGGEEIPTDLWDGCLVVYIHKGEVKYGIYRKYYQTLNLRQDETQILDSVNDTTSRETVFHHIKYLGTINLKGDVIFPEEVQNDLIANAYGAARETGSDKVIHITKEELHNVGSNEFMLFDLVGTNGIACIRAGKMNLICKDNDTSFKSIKGSTHNIKFLKEENPSVYKKINQKPTLNVFTQSFPLNTKFNFEDDSKFRIYVAPITHDYGIPEDESNLTEAQKASNKLQREIQQTSFLDYYHIKIDTPHDYLNTWVQVFKRRGTALQKINPADYELLKSQRQQILDSRWIEQQKNFNYLTDVKTNVARKYEDLNTEGGNSITGIGERALLGGAVGAIKRGNVGSAIIGAAVGAASQTISGIRFWSRDYNIQKDRIREDEEKAYRDNSLAEYARKQNYEHKLKDNLIRLNSMVNTYVQPTTTDDDIQRIFNKGNNGENINVQVLIPSAEQESEIARIYEEFGCTCQSNGYLNNPLRLRSGMEPGVFQFFNLSSNGLKGKLIHDPGINETLRICLNNGVKFIDHVYEAMQEEEGTIIVPKGAEIDFNIDQITDGSKEVGDIYRLKKPKSEILEIIKKTKNFGLTDEEYAANKDKLEGKDGDELLKNIDEIIGHRKQGSVFVIPPPTEDEVQASLLNSLQTKVRELETQITEKEAEIDKYKALYDSMSSWKGDKKEELVKLTKEKEKLEKKLEQMKEVGQQCEKDRFQAIQEMTKLQTELDECKTDRDDFEAQMKQFETDLAQTRNAKETCDLVNARKINELEAKIKNCEEKIKEKQIEIDAKEKGLTASVNRANTLSEDYKRLETKVKDLENQVALYREQAQKARTEKTEAVEGAKRKFKTDIGEILKGFGGGISEDLLPSINVDNLASITKSLSDIVSVKNHELETLKKQKTLLEDQKSDIENQLRECLQSENELNKLKSVNEATINDLQSKNEKLQRELDVSRGVPAEGAVTCKFIKDLIHNTKYDIDIPQDDQGFSNFTKLIFEVAGSIYGIRLSAIDFHLEKYEPMRDIFNKIYEMERDIPAIDKAEDIVKMPGFQKFKKWLVEGGNTNGDVDKVITATNEFKVKYTTMPYVHGTGILLDEIFYLSYKAMEQLKDKMEEDPQLDHFFKHFFPGQKIKTAYKDLYGIDPDFILVKKKFADADCSNIVNPIKWIVDTQKTTQIDVVGADQTRQKMLPSVAPTLRFSDGGELFLDDEMIMTYAFPKKLNKETTYLDSEGMLQRSTVRGRVLVKGTLKNYPYSRLGRKYTWGELRTEGHDSKGAVSNGDSREIYIRVEDVISGGSDKTKAEIKKECDRGGLNNTVSIKNLKGIIQAYRKTGGLTRNYLKLPKKVEQQIDRGSFVVQFVVRNQEYFNTASKNDQQGIVDLVKMFGKKYAADAYKLLIILDSTKTGFQHEGIADSLHAYRFTYRLLRPIAAEYGQQNPTHRYAMQQSFNEFEIGSYVDPELREGHIIENEFVDIRSLVNYIWYHIKRPTEELRDPSSFGEGSLYTFVPIWFVQCTS